MTALHIAFTDDELRALRERAAAEGLDVASFVHDTAMAAAHEHDRLFEEAAGHVLAVSAELNRRLA
jgi:uncharacterized protein (DUF1778 family)